MIFSKIMMGGLAASVLAVGILFFMLMSSKEANGKLQEGINQAAAINNRQKASMEALQANHDNLLVQIEQNRVRLQAATDALEQTQANLTNAEADFDERLRINLEGISDEDLECASEFVPAGIIDSLHEQAADII